MVVLREFKSLQKFIGVSPSCGFGNIVVQVIYWITLFSWNLTFIFYFLLKFRNDIYGALGSMPPFVGFTLLLMTYWHLLIGREQFYSLVAELEDIVNESMKLKQSFSLKKTLSKSNFTQGKKETKMKQFTYEPKNKQISPQKS